jgi:hypothetical protein
VEIGKQGENGVTDVAFDFSEWEASFGIGTVQLLAMRQGDGAPYPVSISVEGTTALWVVSSADTAMQGLGKVQYLYIVNEQVAKTAIFNTIVGKSLDDGAKEPPEPYQSWVDEVLQAAKEIKQATGYVFTDDGGGNITISTTNEEVR